jgi:hypothetical protein
MTANLPMSDKVSYSGLAFLAVGTIAASKTKKSIKLVSMGIGAAGLGSIVSKFMNKEMPTAEETTTADYDDVTAELLSIEGVQRVADSVQRVADYTQFTPIEGVQNIEDYRTV